ncbi:transposase [Streptomyces mirabilis]|nr:transposase [Streptomyces mirabilis]MCX5356334.1 transposase [Streptomyces mirabilis]
MAKPSAYAASLRQSGHRTLRRNTPVPQQPRAPQALTFVLTPGQAADSPRFVAVLEKVRVRGPVGRPRTRPDAVAADKAYSSRANRAYLRRRGIKAVIPEKADQTVNRRKRGRAGGRPVAHDAEQYKERNTVERCINKIVAWRGLATRYDKTPASYMAGLQLRGSIIWIRSLKPGPRSRRPAGKPDAATAHVRPSR